MAASKYTTDAGHLVGTPSEALWRFADFLRAVSEAGSVRLDDQADISPIRCLKRPNRRRCLGRTRIAKKDDGIHWACTVCENEGVITGWRGTTCDLSKFINLDVSPRIVLRLSQDEFDALAKVLLSSVEEQVIVSAAVWRNNRVVITGSADDFDFLAGSIASESNHTNNARLRRILDRIIGKLDALLEIVG